MSSIETPSCDIFALSLFLLAQPLHKFTLNFCLTMSANNGAHICILLDHHINPSIGNLNLLVYQTFVSEAHTFSNFRRMVQVFPLPIDKDDRIISQIHFVPYTSITAKNGIKPVTTNDDISAASTQVEDPLVAAVFLDIFSAKCHLNASGSSLVIRLYQG